MITYLIKSSSKNQPRLPEWRQLVDKALVNSIHDTKHEIGGGQLVGTSARIRNVDTTPSLFELADISIEPSGFCVRSNALLKLLSISVAPLLVTDWFRLEGDNANVTISLCSISLHRVVIVMCPNAYEISLARRCAYRLKLSMTQEAFARTYISGIERGVRNPSLDAIEVLAKTMRVRVVDLIEKMRLAYIMDEHKSIICKTLI